jgi:hypothetical protein
MDTSSRQFSVLARLRKFQIEVAGFSVGIVAFVFSLQPIKLLGAVGNSPKASVSQSRTRDSMKPILFGFFLFTSIAMAEPFPEISSGAVEKTKAWAILTQQWKIIEPELFTPGGTKYLGRPVYFDSMPVTVGKPLIVRTASGTTARVSNIPKGDMDLVRKFRDAPKNITVEGVLTAIDASRRTITIKAYGVRPD